jgi:hypothetical protein
MLVTSPGEQLTDQELLERFEDGTLSHEYFHHREHVRAAFLYLTESPCARGPAVLFPSTAEIRRDPGKPQLYHATVTWAYVFLIHERMMRSPNKPGWEEFARNNPDLLSWKDGILTRYYRA